MRIHVRPRAGKAFPIEGGMMPAEGASVMLTPLIQFLLNCGDLEEVKGAPAPCPPLPAAPASPASAQSTAPASAQSTAPASAQSTAPASAQSTAPASAQPMTAAPQPVTKEA